MISYYLQQYAYTVLNTTDGISIDLPLYFLDFNQYDFLWGYLKDSRFCKNPETLAKFE